MSAELAPEDIGYAAAIIDGEGSIGIGEENRNRLTPQHRIFVVVAMTDSTVPLWFREKFGGYISTYQPKAARRRPLTRWRLQSKEAAKFCEWIAPHLKLKRVQAELVVRFQEEKERTDGRFQPGRRVSRDELSRRRVAALHISRLNRGLVAVKEG